MGKIFWVIAILKNVDFGDEIDTMLKRHKKLNYEKFFSPIIDVLKNVVSFPPLTPPSGAKRVKKVVLDWASFIKLPTYVSWKISLWWSVTEQPGKNQYTHNLIICDKKKHKSSCF